MNPATLLPTRWPRALKTALVVTVCLVVVIWAAAFFLLKSAEVAMVTTMASGTVRVTNQTQEVVVLQEWSWGDGPGWLPAIFPIQPNETVTIQCGGALREQGVSDGQGRMLSVRLNCGEYDEFHELVITPWDLLTRHEVNPPAPTTPSGSVRLMHEVEADDFDYRD